MSDQKQQFRLSVLTLWVGIIIPIVVALIPYAISKATPEQALEFSVSGPITSNQIQAVEINIENNGSKPIKNIEVWLKSSPLYQITEAVRSKGDKARQPSDRIHVSSKNPATISLSNDYFVVKVGDIRAGEKMEVTATSTEGALSIYSTGTHVGGIEVKSDEVMAQLKGTSFLQEIYPFGFWMFVALMVILLIAGLYQEYLMDPKEREKMILKEIDKLNR
jgi:hypothetical protein